MKRSFFIFYSIIFLMIVLIISVMIIRFNSYSMSNISKSYLEIQAELISKSATEFAIMAMQAHDFSKNDLEKILMHYPLFNVEIKFYNFRTDCKNNKCSKIITKDLNMSSVIYVIVTSKDPSLHIRKIYTTLQNP